MTPSASVARICLGMLVMLGLAVLPAPVWAQREGPPPGPFQVQPPDQPRGPQFRQPRQPQFPGRPGVRPGGRPGQPDRQMPDDYWRAWSSTGDDDSRLVVEGIFSEGGLGMVIAVEEAPPEDADPRTLYLELKKKSLAGPWPLILRPIPAHFTKQPYRQGEYTKVQIRYPDGGRVTLDQIHELEPDDLAGNGETEEGPRLLVTQILEAKHEIETSQPPNLVVTATGQVPTGGFTGAKLVRAQYVSPPDDGIQDYYLYVTPPDGPAIQVISQVEATDRWERYTEEADWIQGIRIHGAGGGVVVRRF